MDELVAGIGLGCFFWMAHNLLMSINVYTKLAYRFHKPFGCAMCFSAWVSFGFLIAIGLSIEYILIISGIAGITAETIERKLLG